MTLGTGLGIAGAIVGNMLLPGIGGSLGYLAGYFIGNLLDPPKVEMPEPAMQKVQMSEYGRPIPILYGQDRFAGTVIWQKYPFDKHKQKSGGKGTSPQVTTTTFSTSFAVLLCKGPIDHVEKVFADGRLVWPGDEDNFDFTLYLGDEDQLPDPTMEGELGVGQVPAYRGYAYAVFTDLMLKQFGERIPQLEWVVSTKPYQDIPIERIAENYSNASIEAPRIMEWDLNGSQITVVSAPWNVSRDPRHPSITADSVSQYDRDMNYTGSAAVAGYAAPRDFDLCNEAPLAAGDEYLCYSVGNYYQDSSSDPIPLWVRFTSGSNDFPGPFGIAAAVGSPPTLTQVDWPMLFSMDTYSKLPTGNPNVNIPAGIEYASYYGVPAGEFIGGSSLTEDGTRLYLFTAPSSGAHLDKWYEIISGVIARQGTISPTFAKHSLGYGNSAAPWGGGSLCNMTENNGQFMWVYNSNSSGPLGGLTGGIVSIYEFDPNTLNFAANSFFSYAAAGGASGASVEGSIKVLKTGYAGIIRGDGKMAIFRRVMPDPGVVLGDIVADISSMTPLDATEYDTSDLTQIVPGYRITSQMEAGNAIQPLRQAYFFDAAETDGVVVFKNRGGASVLTLTDEDMGATSDGADEGLVSIERIDELELPQRVTVDFIDLNFDYQKGTEYEERQTTSSQSQTSLSLPIVLDGATAKAIAKSLLWSAYLEREHFSWRLPRKFIKLDPTDVVEIDGKELRIETSTVRADGVIELTGVISRISAYPDPNSSSSTGGGSTVIPPDGSGVQNPPLAIPLTTLVLLDIPLLSQHDAPFGFYAAMAPATTGPWSGATLYKSLDGGVSWVAIANTSYPDVLGTVAEALWSSGTSGGGSPIGSPMGSPPHDILTVTLSDDDAELSSCTATALANGANLFALQSGTGWELCQFQTATLIAPRTYEITVDVRGAFGTSAYQSGHSAGDQFVLLPCVNVDAPENELNQSFKYKAVSYGAALTTGTVQDFTNTGTATQDFYDTELDNLGVFVGDNSTGGPAPRKGLVPAPYIGAGGEEAVLMATTDGHGSPSTYWGVPSWAGGAGSPGAGAIEIQEEGVTVTYSASTLNFIGAAVTAALGSPTVAGKVDITVSGGSVVIQEDGATVDPAASVINFGVGIEASSGSPTGGVNVHLKATGVTPAVYGGTNYFPVLTINAYGQITNASQTPMIGAIETINHGSLVDAAAIALYFDSGLLALDDGYGITRISAPTFAPVAGSPFNGCTAGIVPASSSGDSTKCLLGDGTWGYPGTITGSLGGNSQGQVFTTPGANTFNVPAGVSLVEVTMIGGGGGGSTTITAAQGGGGGGSGESVFRLPVVVTPGGTVTVTIGAKGTGGAAGSGSAQPGTDGGDTSFGSLWIAKGGKGGSATASGAGGGVGGGAARTGAPSTGALGSPESPCHFGGSSGGNGGNATGTGGAQGGGSAGYVGGAAGASASSQAGGGGGAASPWGTGGAAGAGGAIGSSASATAYGAGGGGGGAKATTTIGGGDGAPGYCLVTWIG